MQVSADVIAFLESPVAHPERWVLMNVAARTCLGVGPEVFDVLSAPGGNGTDRTYRVWRISRFSNADGLLADPSRFRRDAASWGEPEMVPDAVLVERLLDACILIADPVAYRQRFDAKRSLLDRTRFGNYHEQLGQHLMVVERQDPSQWWVSQKFTPDLVNIRADNLYGAVQDAFLTRWLPSRIEAGSRVLDLGCGPGVIARKMASLGADVLGLDPNPDYVRLATAHAVGTSRFEARDLNQPGVLDDLASGSFDYIFMSDALLFYFVPYQRGKPLDLAGLVADIARLLKPGGRFLSLEPHPVFYQLPWLGDEAHPFTVMTEYLRTSWRINPPLATLTRPFLSQGFVITGLEELRADEHNTAVDARAKTFATEFPVWLLLEMQPPRVS